MTNMEILGELKQSWEYMNDIKDNNANQLTEKEKEGIKTIMSSLYDIYDGLYNRIMKENSNELYTRRTIFGNEIYIGDNIATDYSVRNMEILDITNKVEFVDILSCEDINYYWYKDKEVLK